MPEVRSLQMVTPFESSFANLHEREQLLMLQGCALCRITRRLDEGSTRSKQEWKTCRAELGVPVEVFTVDVAPTALLEAVGHRAPAVAAVTRDGRTIALMDPDALERCRGSVADLRGRLAYRLASLGLTLPDAASGAA